MKPHGLSHKVHDVIIKTISLVFSHILVSSKTLKKKPDPLKTLRLQLDVSPEALVHMFLRKLPGPHFNIRRTLEVGKEGEETYSFSNMFFGEKSVS